MNSPQVKIGILTDGEPRFEPSNHEISHLDNGDTLYSPRTDDATILLHNLLIGHHFHWHRVLQANIPGKILLKKNGYPRLINILDIEQYLIRVVGSEMNPSSPIEFLKAHAIVARSWLMGKILHSHPESDKGKINTPSLTLTWQDTADHHGFDVCSDDHCQRYQGNIPVSHEAIEAFNATSGLILCDSKGEIADCRFSKCCGGTTELFSSCWQDIDFDYLPSISCPHCNPENMSKTKLSRLLSSCFKDYDAESKNFFSWEVSIPESMIINNLKRQHNIELDSVDNIYPLHRGPSGRISLLRVVGVKNSKPVYHDFGKELTIRRLLSDTHLYSSAFEIRKDGNDFIIHGHGWGHGVGMCQIGAASMALDGALCDDILSLYYPNTIIQNCINLNNPHA